MLPDLLQESESIESELHEAAQKPPKNQQQPLPAVEQARELRAHSTGKSGGETKSNDNTPALLQAKELKEAVDAESVKQTAARGFEGTAQKMPHLDKIQQSFGHHNVSGIEAHTGGSAQKASKEIGAKGYAAGNQVAFGGQPDLQTAAHEAAHVVQQRSGVSLAQGVGKSGDVYEKHADTVAQKVAAGKPAASLLDATPGSLNQGERPVQMDPDPNAPPAILNASEERSAISFNKGKGISGGDWAKAATVVGASSGELNGELVQKLAQFQKAKNLGVDGKAGSFTWQWLSLAPGGEGLEKHVKTNDVIYLGLNPDSRISEIRTLRATAGSKRVAACLGNVNQDTGTSGGSTIDLTDDEQLTNAIDADYSGLTGDQRKSFKAFIQRASSRSKDELFQLGGFLYQMESGQAVRTMMILSGHSAGYGISGEDENPTSISFWHLTQLPNIFPNACNMIQDLMVSACNTGQRGKLEQYTQIFPRLKSIWAYVGYSPAAPSSNFHIQQWYEGAKGILNVDRLRKSRERVARRGGKNDKHVAAWTREEGGKITFETASEEAAEDYQTMRGWVDDNLHHYRTAMDAGNINKPALNELYTQMQNLVGNFRSQLRGDYNRYKDMMLKTLYLRHWSAVTSKFMGHFGDKVKAGYGEATPTPRYASMDRASVLAAINAYPGMDDDEALTLLTTYLKVLHISSIQSAEATTGPWY